MPIPLKEESEGKVVAHHVTLHIRGKLIAADCGQFGKTFTRAMIKYFDHADLGEAKQWLEQA